MQDLSVYFWETHYLTCFCVICDLVEELSFADMSIKSLEFCVLLAEKLSAEP